MNNEVARIVVDVADHPRLSRVVSSTSGVIGYHYKSTLVVEIDPIPGLYGILVAGVGLEGHHHALATINCFQLLSKSLHGYDKLLIPSKHSHVDKDIIRVVFIQNMISCALYIETVVEYCLPGAEFHTICSLSNSFKESFVDLRLTLLLQPSSETGTRIG